MSDTNTVDLGTPAEVVAQLADSPLENATRIDTTPGFRTADIVHETMENKDEVFRLDQDTLTTLADVLETHFTVFGEPGASREPWQEGFRTSFIARLKESTGKELASMTRDEKREAIKAEARKFVAEAQNLPLAISISEFHISAIQRAYGAKIEKRKNATPHTHIEQPWENAGTGVGDFDPSITPLGNMVRKVVGSKPILGFEQHLTPFERKRFEAERAAARVARRENTKLGSVVTFGASRTVDFSNLSLAQQRLIQHYGRDNNEAFDATEMTARSAELQRLTDTRINFYTATGLDRSKIEVDFSSPGSTLVQEAHTRTDIGAARRLFTVGLANTVESARLTRASEATSQFEANTTRLLNENALKKDEERERAILEAQIEPSPSVVNEAVTAAEKKKIEADREAEQKKFEKAEARELVEKDVKAKEDRIQEIEGEVGATVIADYETWLGQIETTRTELVKLKMEKAKVQSDFDRLSALETRAAELAKPAARSSNPKRSGTSSPTPPSPIPSSIAENEYKRITDEINKITGKYNTEDIHEKIGRLNSEIEQKTDESNTVPAAWNEQTNPGVRTSLEERRKLNGEVARLKARIAAGTGTLYVAESSKDIQKRLDALTKREEGLGKPDRFERRRIEANKTYMEYVMSSSAQLARDSRLQQLDRATAARPYELTYHSFYGDYPRAYVRALQLAFGEDIVTKSPTEFDRLAQLIPPEKFIEIYNQLHPGAVITVKGYKNMSPARIKRTEVEAVLAHLKDKALGLNGEKISLGKVTEVEQRQLSLIESFQPDGTTPKPDVTRVRSMDKTIYFYRDTADLQRRILIQWALSVNVNKPYAYLNRFSQKRIQQAALYAREIDALRTRRRAQAFGG